MKTSMRELRELIFGFDVITNDYIGQAICPFCGKQTEYYSYETASTVCGCNHVYGARHMGSSRTLQVVFER